ncbi:transmembrane protein 45B [Elysia marginata]|uniref:Transmembrane protein 45B n=1 Tax=Elysia marginata TaxID=1093978 RepID=A0AAV4J932_9GAST|nr:transmembrane protein 45B [Elysia marginata]
MLTKQHSTIAFALLTAALSEPFLSRDLDYVANACFFLVETFTIYWHLHGSALEYRVHVLFLVTIVMGFVAVVAEAKAKHHMVMPILRGSVFMLKGTWLVQVSTSPS